MSGGIGQLQFPGPTGEPSDEKDSYDCMRCKFQSRLRTHYFQRRPTARTVSEQLFQPKIRPESQNGTCLVKQVQGDLIQEEVRVRSSFDETTNDVVFTVRRLRFQGLE